MHNKSGTKIYITWASMIARCYNKNNKKYKDYGGRGIKICNKWLNFQGFYQDMGDKPIGLTLDRIDTNKDYYKENCRWATQKQQQRNKRNNRLITYKDETKYVSDWADFLKIKAATLYSRLNKSNWNIEEIFNLPINCNNKHDNLKINRNKKSNKFITYKGETKCIAEWAELLKINPCTLWDRFNSGWTIKQAFETKVSKSNRINHEN